MTAELSLVAALLLAGILGTVAGYFVGRRNGRVIGSQEENLRIKDWLLGEQEKMREAIEKAPRPATGGDALRGL